MTENLRANVFGDGRAEFDHAMLDRSFYEWQDYKTLISSNDRFVVVGRRGTGKSALTYRLAKDWRSQKRATLVMAPAEEQMIGLRSAAAQFGDSVSRIRAGIKIAWRYCLLLELSGLIEANYKTKDALRLCATTFAHLTAWRRRGDSPFERLRSCLREHLPALGSAEDRIADLARTLNLNRITEEVSGVLRESGHRYAILVDRLDEGYEPDNIGIGIVDGIIYGLDEVRHALDGQVSAIAFLRDNIFRAIEEADGDFSRNIEGQVLRLHWDPLELFHLINKRIRAAFDISQESDVKAWNRYAHEELRGIDGFKQCLKLTLYRPRDLLALLNFAHLHALKQDRRVLMQVDLEASAQQISRTRYDDLVKEYAAVFPGIRSFTQAFVGSSPEITVSDAKQKISDLVAANNIDPIGLQHERILGGAEGVITALYGVGFFGLIEPGTGRFIFSHDGKRPNLVYDDSSRLLIHPCYAIALNLTPKDLSVSTSEDIFDDYEISISSESKELRDRKLGQMISEVASIPMGEEGASQFEEWCERAVEIAFARNLTNIELHPNRQHVQRRDIVATNQGKSGFWHRLLNDYESRQVVFEVKNYEKIGVDEYRQVSGYLGREYGRFAFVICRDQLQELQGRDLEAFREFYSLKSHVIVKLTVRRLTSILSKLRNPQKNDDIDRIMDKILDAHIRLYAVGQTERRGRRSKSKSSADFDAIEDAS